MGVSQSWYYKWRDGDASVAHARRAQLGVEIGRVFAKHNGRYGSPRISADLRAEGWVVSVNTVAKVMAEQGLAARRKKRRKSTTRQDRGRWRAPDLIRRDFGADGLNVKWYGDGTLLRTGEGKLYLDSVMDVGSRRIIGYAIGEHHDARLAEAALQTAIAARGGRARVVGVIMYTDQGSEYTAGLFRKACTRCRIQQSMGRVGSALDNSVIESWHSTLEFELRSLEHFPTRQAARGAVAAWIADYNQSRRHSGIGMRSPIQYERETAAAAQQSEAA